MLHNLRCCQSLLMCIEWVKANFPFSHFHYILSAAEHMISKVKGGIHSVCCACDSVRFLFCCAAAGITRTLNIKIEQMNHLYSFPSIPSPIISHFKTRERKLFYSFSLSQPTPLTSCRFSVDFPPFHQRPRHSVFAIRHSLFAIRFFWGNATFCLT